MVDQVERLLKLKAVRYRSGRLKDFHSQPIHQILKDVFEPTKTVGDRLVIKEPPSNAPGADTWNCFAHHIESTDNVCMFEYGSYQPGSAPMQMAGAFDQANLDLGAQPITNDDGDPVELVNVYQVLAIGDVVIVESKRGTGGLGLLAYYLTQMIRRRKGDEHPSLFLQDVGTPDFHDAVKRGGGIVQVVMNLANLAPLETAKFAKTLDSSRSRIANAQSFGAVWRNKTGTLNEDQVLGALEESEGGGGVEGVVVYLANGDTYNGTGKYAIRKTVKVKDVGLRNASRSDVRQSMREYLPELRAIQGKTRIINERGELVYKPE